jgi:murein L,D-transpeptidase YcbB/YkuD
MVQTPLGSDISSIVMIAHASPTLPAVRRAPHPAAPGLLHRLVPALPARRVQELLVAHDLLDPAAVTGRYDRATLDAVARFQARCGLVVDGMPGTVTADALLA